MFKMVKHKWLCLCSLRHAINKAISINLSYTLIHKHPAKSKTHPQTCLRIQWCSKIVFIKPKTLRFGIIHGIKIVDLAKEAESRNPKIQVIGNIRAIADTRFILVKKLPHERWIVIRFVRRIIPCFNTCSQKKVFEKIAFKSNPVPNEYQWNIQRHTTCLLLHIGFYIPFEIFAQFCFFF